mmetsp:Transcript_4852/g.7470  ORF Transcript_4852/g.7470 Transcript_4852/m.7470 type:complete len:275 (-) Transcript_4852:236-1060(-)
MDGSVEENILLGLPMQRDWYNEVLKCCGLNVDFARFRDGDQTIVGDRGVQCSGGQRARIGLARALYRDADIILLDDPLSAVDAKVCRLLFYEAIMGLAVTRGKCVVLATHQHQFLGRARCVLIEDGRLLCDGSYAECVSASGGKLGNAGNSMNAFGAKKRAVKKEKIDSQVVNSTNENLVSSVQDELQEMNVTGIVRNETFINYSRAMGGVWVGIVFFGLFSITQAAALGTIAAIGNWGEMSTINQVRRLPICIDKQPRIHSPAPLPSHRFGML